MQVALSTKERRAVVDEENLRCARFVCWATDANGVLVSRPSTPRVERERGSILAPVFEGASQEGPRLVKGEPARAASVLEVARLTP